jgi:hypothetical protein
MTATCFPAPAPVSRRVRAYFAPVDRTAQRPVLFDPAQQGSFDLDHPPAPWINLGFIQNFARKAISNSSAIACGVPAAPLEQVRESIGAQVGLQFLAWTKLSMALAAASQHMNAIAPDAPAATVQSGSTATMLVLSANDAARFAAGQIVAVDLDYCGQTGYIGSPISGAYLRQPLTDADYIRRITFNTGLVTQVTGSTLHLALPLAGGVPASGSKVQPVAGFVDREGGSFYHEWSGLFVMEGVQGERILFHYPRLQPMGSAEESALPLAAKGQGRLERVVLNAQFLALPVTDPLDNERIVCYRSFLPAGNALV